MRVTLSLLSTHDTHVKHTMVERQLPYNITIIYLHLDSISHLYWTLEPTEQQAHSILNDWRTMWTQQIPTCTNLPLLLMPTRYITACDEFYLVFVLQATNVWVRRPGTKLHSCRIDSWPYLPWSVIIFRAWHAQNCWYKTCKFSADCVYLVSCPDHTSHKENGLVSQ